jgi:hypothetical protein
MFLVLLFVRIVVESVKESQGGFESTLGLLSRSVVEYSFILIWTILYLLQKNRVVYKNYIIKITKRYLQLSR